MLRKLSKVTVVMLSALLMLVAGCGEEDPRVPAAGQWISYGVSNLSGMEGLEGLEFNLAFTRAEDYGKEACLWLEGSLTDGGSETYTGAVLVEEEALLLMNDELRERIDKPRLFNSATTEPHKYDQLLEDYDPALAREACAELQRLLDPFRRLIIELSEGGRSHGYEVDLYSLRGLWVDEVPELLELGATLQEQFADELEGLGLDELEETPLTTFQYAGRESVDVLGNPTPCVVLAADSPQGALRLYLTNELPLFGLARIEIEPLNRLPLFGIDEVVLDVTEYGLSGAESRLRLEEGARRSFTREEIKQYLALARMLAAFGSLGAELEEQFGGQEPAAELESPPDDEAAPGI